MEQTKASDPATRRPTLDDGELLLAESVRSYEASPDFFADRYQRVDVADYRAWLLRALDPTSTRNRILDAGCGGGRDTAAFASLGYETTGLDLSAGMLRAARTAVGEAPLICADLRATPFPDGSFDAIWAMASLVHLTSTQVLEALREFRRIVCDVGPVFVAVPSAPNSGWRNDDNGERRWFRNFDLATAATLAERSGFAVERAEEEDGKLAGRWVSLLLRPASFTE
jgi:SAM-dependent methyltransferase